MYYESGAHGEVTAADINVGVISILEMDELRREGGRQELRRDSREAGDNRF